MKKILTYFLLPAIIIALVYLLSQSIMEPARFQKDTKYRESAGIERLKSIRTLQVAYKSAHGKYTGSIDTLIDFYKNGKITVVRQIGSMDDSLAVAQKRVRRDSIPIFVRDTLFKDAAYFIADSLKYIPFSGGKEVELIALTKSVSGVLVPLFEANMPYDDLLSGLDRQLVVNLKAQKVDMNRYPGLKVGSVSNPNNNAGNWE